jgi:hypothetical protein
LPRAREKQRRESVRREGYDSNQANTYTDATSEPGSRDPRWFEGSQLEEVEEEARGRKKKKEASRSEQATESTRRMPRRSRPRKDAETGETFRGSCMQAKSPEIPNGATPPE